MKYYFGNAFSLQMVQAPATISVTELTQEIIEKEIVPVVGSQIISCVGHPDTASVLKVPMNRMNVSLEKGDVLFVAQLQGGRLPEGATTLPEGFSFKYLKVIVS